MKIERGAIEAGELDGSLLGDVPDCLETKRCKCPDCVPEEEQEPVGELPSIFDLCQQEYTNDHTTSPIPCPTLPRPEGQADSSAPEACG